MQNILEKLFNKLTNDVDECGNDVIEVDGAEIVDGEDLGVYFKNTIVSNLEYDTGYHLSESELKQVLNTIGNNDITEVLGSWLDINIDSSNIPEDVKDAIANAYVKAEEYFKKNETVSNI